MIHDMADALGIQREDFLNRRAFAYAGHSNNGKAGGVGTVSLYGLIAGSLDSRRVSFGEHSGVFPRAGIPVQVSLPDTTGDSLFYIDMLFQRLEIVKQALDTVHTVMRVQIALPVVVHRR